MPSRQYRSTVEAKTLSTGITSGASSIIVNSVTTLPNSYPYTLVLDPDTNKEEIVTVTSLIGGNVLAVTRGQDGTSAQAHDASAVIKHMVTARDLQEPQDHIYASSGVHGVTGSVVGLSDTQTLTNKTLASPTLNTPKINENVALTATSTELNILDGATLTTTELNYVDGVTSAIQTQFNNQTSALASHEADTTSIHGVADTSKLATFASTSVGRKLSVQATAPSTPAIGDIWFQVTGL